MNKSSRLIIHLAFILAGALLLVCDKKTDDMRIIVNDAPKYSDIEYAKLDLIISIDITDINILSRSGYLYDLRCVIDFDEKHNMYILDQNENTITVFNDSGEKIYTLGSTGLGPHEFAEARRLIINRGRIFVLQQIAQNCFKIVDYQGEFIAQQFMPWMNAEFIKIIKNEFYIYHRVFDKTFTNFEMHLTRWDMGFSKSRTIFKYKFIPGWRGPHYNFKFVHWILITENGDFFFPENNLNKYSIIKYDNQGRPLLNFSRKYAVQKYTPQAKEVYVQSNSSNPFPKNPPVIRKMVQDARNNIWVVSGEIYDDNLIEGFENTIDIFDKNGIWLYSFKSDILSVSWLHHDGKIYSFRTDGQTFHQYIDVYEIKYNHY